ncbi:MAG: permease prefix domain 2-containing transporter, partial [Bacteroidota bacterium]
MNTSPTPPQWADRFLSWFCKPALLEMIQGDLHEQFCQMVEDQVPRVRWRYGWEVVRLCRPPIIRRNLFESSTTSIAMWKNYFQIAWRNLLKQKGYSLINLGGLTLGILCFLFLYAYIRHEDSYDTFHEKGDRIMQGYWNAYWDGESQVIGVTPTALLPTLMEKFPEVETGVRLYRPSTTTFPAVVQKGDTQFEEVGFTYADSTFFDVFSFELLQGNPKTALAEPNSLVLSTESAFKYFGTTNVLGEELVVNGTPYAITGVVLDAPSNTNVDYSILASFSSHRKSQQHSWWSASLFTYVVLRPGAHLPDVLEKLNGIVEDAVGDNLSGDDRLEYS